MNTINEKNQNGLPSRQTKKLVGESLLEAIFRLTKSVALHQSASSMILERIDEFKKVVREVQDAGFDPSLIRSEGQFYLGDERIQFTRKNFGLVNQMIDIFYRRGVAGLSFSETMLDVPVKEIFTFFKIFQEAEKEISPEEYIKKAVEEKTISWVEVHLDMIKASGLEPLSPKEQARRSYLHSIATVKEAYQKIEAGQKGGIRKAKRLAQNLVDVARDNEAILLGMTTLKNYDDYTYNHSVNVAVMAICLGKKIGLEPKSLMELAICGLFHDLGKTLIPKNILNKQGKLDDSEWDEIRKHPLNSVCNILKLQAPYELKARVILSPFEHHQRYDLSGYPRASWKSEVSLFGRILGIVDCYDAMTSERSYRDHSISPDRSLSFLLEKSGKDYDPVILKVFIQMMGIFPSGTFVELDTGEKGLVIENNADSEMLDRPKVLLLFDEKGEKLTDNEIVDLNEKDEKSDRFKRTIKSSADAKENNINPAEYLW